MAQSGTTTVATYIDSYDALGRPLAQRQRFETGAVLAYYGVGRTYDRAGNVTSQTYPSGRTVGYTYDAAGRLATFSGNLGDGQTRTYASDFSYDEQNRQRQEKFGTTTPVYNKSFYNASGQLSEIRVSTHSLTSPGNETNWNRGAIINHYSLQSWAGTGTDNNGNLRKQDVYIPNDDAISGSSLTTQVYTYDSLNRLDVAREDRGATTQWQQDYAYDRWGNRTINPSGTSGGVNATPFSVNPNTNQLGVPAGSPSQMTYDAAGNLTYDTYTGQGTRSFDAEGRMTSAQDAAGRTSVYSYDADGRRARRVTGGESVWQVYGMGGQLLAEYAAGAPPASVTKEYGYRGGELLVTAEATTNAPKITAASATASNTSAGSAPSFVLDGNAGTSWVAGGYPAQWVQLDLGQTYNLSKVRMQVEQSPAGRTVHEVWGGATTASMTLLGFIDSTTQSGEWLQLTTPAANVRYVKVQTTAGPSWVAWREVEVYGNPTGSGMPANLALGRPATQASTYSTAVASRAVDGNTDGTYSNNSVTHTAGAGQDWWQVDLGSVQPVGEVRVWNRTDCCAERLANFYVLVSDAPFASTDLNATLSQAGVSGFYTSGQGGRPTVVSAGRTGRYVRVQLSAAGILSLAEVEVVRAGAAELRWVVSDQLGTPRMTVDLSGSLAGVRRHDYLPFGEEINIGIGGRTTNQGYSSGDNIRQKWHTLERDGETGLDYAQARYYARAQGRFTSPDPLLASGRPAIPQSWNRYAYAVNSPLVHSDPTGLDWYEERFEGGIRPIWHDKNPGGMKKWKDDVYYADAQKTWVALNPWENEASAHDSLGAAAGAIEWYRQQAAINWTAGYAEALSFTAWGARLASGITINENSNQYRNGMKAGTIMSVAAVFTGVGATSLIDDAARLGGNAAHNAANGVRLNKSLASAQQVGEVGTVMAGPGGRRSFRDAARIASEYGGSPSDWVKMNSSSYSAADGFHFETHWVQNVKTGQRVEFKSKFPDMFNWQ